MTRIGASQVFFNIVAQFNAEKLIKDYRSINTVMKAVSLDTFEAILKPVEGLAQGINKITDELGPLQEALGLASVEFEKFFGTVPAMETMRDSVMDLGQEFAQTGVEALAAGSRAAQVANLVGRGNVEVLTKLAYTLAEISDLNAEEAQRGIIQLHQQTGMLFGELNQESFQRLSLQEQQNVLVEEGAKALDALNTIANRSVALEGDLVRVMGTFAAQGELVGDSFEFMAAASATLLEAGEEQGTAGRALRMMYARLGGDISGARSQIEAMGFELTDNEGNMLKMQDVLTELSEKGWAGFSGAQKQNIAQTIAGNRHYVRFIKLMENYERTMQLATDGAMGFDSALGQANKALSEEVNLLKKAQVENENLRSKIGEGLTPFMRGQVEVQNDYLGMTEVLTDSLGGLGEALGRLKGTMEVMGTFIKIGLATQSMGIGFEMFTSVQRQLNGILVANEHLHSKQANYFDYGVRQTATQRDLMAGVQFIQQKINMHAQERRLAEQVVNYYLNDENSASQKLLALEEKRAEAMGKMFAAQRKLSAAKKLQIVEENQLAGIAQRRFARIEYEGTYESNMLETVTNLYSEKSATQDAMMRQYLADLEVAQNLTEGEVLAIEDRHALLREEHTLLQTLKADNELRFRATGGGYFRDSRKGDPEGLPPYIESGVTLSPRESALIMERMDHVANASRIGLDKALKKAGHKDLIGGSIADIKEGYKGDEDIFGFTADLMAVDTFNKQLQETGQITANTSYEFGLMKKSIKQVQGEFIQAEQAMKTIELAQQDLTESSKRLRSVQNALNQTSRALHDISKERFVLTFEDAELQKRMAPLIQKVNDERKNEATRKEALLDLTTALTQEEHELNEAHKEYIQSDKEQLKFAKDKKMAFRQLGFAMQNSIGLISGFIGGPTGAALSMVMFGSNIAAAGVQAGVAASKIVTMTFAQTANAIQADIAAKKQGLFVASLGATNAAVIKTTASLVAMAAPFVAITGGLVYLHKDAERTRDSLEDLNTEMLDFENIMNSIDADKKILEDDTLAELIGIDNATTREMQGNGAKIESTIQQLQGAMGKYTDQQNAQINNAIAYLGVLVDTNDYMQNTLNKTLFEQTSRDAFSRLGDKGFALKTMGEYVVGARADNEAAGAQLFDDIGHGYAFRADTDKYGYFDVAAAMSSNLGSIHQFMKAGNKLSEEQLSLAEEYFNDDAITSYLRAQNALVQTDEMRAYNLAKVAQATANVNQLTGEAVDDIKNLTDEIYNFSGAREELFFGGKYGNVTGSLYKTVVKQGVGTLYNKSEVIMTNNFHGFFNEREAAARITDIVTEVLATQ